MRVSDEDRRRVVDELRRHCAAGRLDVDDYAARIERALSATTFEELDEVRSDLPMLRIAEPAGRGTRPGGGSNGGALGALSGGGQTGPGYGSYDQPGGRRPMAIALAAITVAVVMAALAIGLVAEWTWSVVLIAAWAAGLVQGRLSRRIRPD